MTAGLWKLVVAVIVNCTDHVVTAEVTPHGYYHLGAIGKLCGSMPYAWFKEVASVASCSSGTDRFNRNMSFNHRFIAAAISVGNIETLRYYLTTFSTPSGLKKKLDAMQIEFVHGIPNEKENVFAAYHDGDDNGKLRMRVVFMIAAHFELDPDDTELLADVLTARDLKLRRKNDDDDLRK